MGTVDSYIEDVIKRGDEGSALLARLTAPTLRNSPYVDVVQEGMNGVAVVRVPQGYDIIVHSTTGDQSRIDPAAHATSLVTNLVQQAQDIRATPVGFANIIDSRTGDSTLLQTIGTSLATAADAHNVAVLNGENAILGDRVAVDANISGTMISLIPSNEGPQKPVFTTVSDIIYARFNPEGKPVYINVDGVGTKTEFHERARTYPFAVGDWFAMVMDDAAKLAATVKVVAGVLETRRRIPFLKIRSCVTREAQDRDIIGILHHTVSNTRIRGYNEDTPSFNLGGAAVSTIDEERLKHPLTPTDGNSVVAIRGEPNPRSNGITQKRKLMIQLFGEDWHQTREGRLFLEYLATPSTVLYDVFQDLIKTDLATGVFHMSGGAYEGKLAKPLSRLGLRASLDNLFLPDWRELTLAGACFSSAADAYRKWPMGNDGFVTTQKPDKALEIIDAHGLEGRVVGYISTMKPADTGVGLIVPTTREQVTFTGKG